jgi:acyl-CoA thioesterase
VVVTEAGAPLDAVGPVERARIAAADPASEFGNFFLGRFLNLDISYDDEAQTCQVVLPYAPYLCNPQGPVHGGIITTAMDISMGHLCHRFLATAVTIEMQLRFFRPLAGTGRIEGRLMRPGRRIVHLESRLFDEHNKLAAYAVGSWHRLDSVQPTP